MLTLPTLPGAVESPSHLRAANLACVIKALDEQKTALVHQKSKCKQDLVSLLSSFNDEDSKCKEGLRNLLSSFAGSGVVSDCQHEKEIEVASVSMDAYSTDCAATDSSSYACTAGESQDTKTDEQVMPACQHGNRFSGCLLSPDFCPGACVVSNPSGYLCAANIAKMITALDEDNALLVRQKAKNEEDLMTLLSGLDDLDVWKPSLQVCEVQVAGLKSTMRSCSDWPLHEAVGSRQGHLSGHAQAWQENPVDTDLRIASHARPGSKSSSSFIPGSAKDVPDVMTSSFPPSRASSTALSTPSASSAALPTPTTSSNSETGSAGRHVVLNVFSPSGSRATSASSQRTRASAAVSSVGKSFRGAASKVKQLFDFGRWHVPSSWSNGKDAERQQAPWKLDAWGLHYAARDGDAALAWQLLLAKADPRSADSCGITALHLASEGGHDEIVQLLLEAGVSPDVCTLGCKPSASGITALHAASLAGNSGVVKLLLKASAAPSQARGDGVTALHFAVQGGHADTVNLLLEGSADANALGAGGFTPLHDAAHAGQEHIVHALLTARANPNAATGEGTTPLHGAARCGHVGITHDLLTSGASCQARSAGGFSPLHDAAHAGHMRVVLQLLEAGAAPKDKSENGSTAIQLAAHAGHKDVAAVMARKHVQLMRAMRQSANVGA
mmetsp:Transcript_33371/g.54972  ORF Transcript_33371/g.54972 Transcript_33371/m.54972 type:complete len:671 (+) Transcript_33371:62-2074(+)